MNRYTTILTIAGSDSIAGAGIQADLKTASAMGVYAATAITAITAQNTRSVVRVQPVAAEMLRAQIDAVCSDIHPDAVKIGMLPSAESISVVAESIKMWGMTNVVLDPVAAASTGRALHNGADWINTLKTELFPLCTLITPNLDEASLLFGTTDASHLAQQCPSQALLLKGGHARGDESIDILIYPDGRQVEFSAPRIQTRNDHGTGCTLSSAIACGLARKLPVQQAVAEAKEFLSSALRRGADYDFGHGHGPLCHFNQAIIRQKQPNKNAEYKD